MSRLGFKNRNLSTFAVLWPLDVSITNKYSLHLHKKVVLCELSNFNLMSSFLASKHLLTLCPCLRCKINQLLISSVLRCMCASKHFAFSKVGSASDKSYYTLHARQILHLKWWLNSSVLTAAVKSIEWCHLGIWLEIMGFLTALNSWMNIWVWNCILA